MTHLRSAALLSLALTLAACGTVTPAPRASSAPQTQAAPAQPQFIHAPGTAASLNTLGTTSTPGGATMSVNPRFVPLPNPANAFTFLAPLKPSALVNPAWADASLLTQLSVRLCIVSGSTCTPLSTITSTSGGSYALKFDLKTGQYQTTLSLKDTGLSVGSVLRVQVAMESLLLGQLDLTLLSNGNLRTTSGALLSVNSTRSLPITFYVKNHITIRAFSLAARKYTATQVAAALKREFLAASAQTLGGTTGASSLMQSPSTAAAQTVGSVQALGIVGPSSLPPVNPGLPVPVTTTSNAYELFKDQTLVPPVQTSDLDSYLALLSAELKKTDYTASQTGTALRDTAGVKQAEAARKLAAAGYNADQVGRGLKDTYPTSSPTDIAGLLKTVQFGLTDVGLTLRDVFASTPVVATGILQSVGFFALSDATTWQSVGTVLRDVFSTTAVQAVGVLKGFDVLNVGSAATWTNLGDTLKIVFSQTADQALNTLKSADVLNLGNAATWTGLGTMLKTSFGQAADTTVGTLKTTFESFAAPLAPLAQQAAWEALGGMLKDVYKQSADQTWGLIKQSGLTIANPQMWASVGTMFEVTFGSTAAEGAAILKHLGASFDIIGPVLKDVFGSTATGAATIIKDLGATFDQVGSVLKNTFKSAASDTASIIKGIGGTFTDVGSVLKDVFNSTAAEAAPIIKGLGASFTVIGFILKETFNNTPDQIIVVYKAIGAGLEDFGYTMRDVFLEDAQSVVSYFWAWEGAYQPIGQALYDVFKTTPADTAKLIGVIGGSFNDAGVVLSSVYGQSATQVANTLNSIGATASDIAGVLKDTFNWSVTDVGTYLRDTLGLAQDAAATALGYAGFAASAISDWAGDAWDTIKGGFCGIFGC